MAGYALRRLAQALVVLIGVSIAVFALVHLVPGDPVRLALGTRYDPESYAALRERSGLDDPIVVQYFGWAGRALTGDLGVSFRTGEPVTGLLTERLPATLSLAAAALLVALLIAVPLGVLGALRARSAVDHLTRVFSQAGVSVPEFWMGLVLILVFAAGLDVLPSSGYVSPTEDVGDWLQHLVLPAITVGLVSGSILTRFVRSAVLEVLSRDYTRTARAKGLPETVVIRRHVGRPAAVPVVTVTGVQLAYLLSGVVVAEVVFAWPGMGLLALQAVQSRDYPLLQGAVLLFACVVLLISLLVDLLYAYLDPRIGYEEPAG